MQSNAVRKERTGRRDLALNRRHREYGYDCPAIDLDLFLEFDCGAPSAIIEYKFIKAAPVNLASNTLFALESLATHANIPAFVVWYHKSPWRFWVLPMNELGQSWLPYTTPQLMTERKFVGLLYALRSRLVPLDIEAELDNEIVGDEREPSIVGYNV